MMCWLSEIISTSNLRPTSKGSGAYTGLVAPEKEKVVLHNTTNKISTNNNLGLVSI